LIESKQKEENNINDNINKKDIQNEETIKNNRIIKQKKLNHQKEIMKTKNKKVMSPLKSKEKNKEKYQCHISLNNTSLLKAHKKYFKEKTYLIHFSNFLQIIRKLN